MIKKLNQQKELTLRDVISEVVTEVNKHTDKKIDDSFDEFARMVGKQFAKIDARFDSLEYRFDKSENRVDKHAIHFKGIRAAVQEA